MDAGWVVVRTFDLSAAATMAQMRLEQEGIPGRLADTEIVHADWFLSNAIGGIKLLVPTGSAERARKILDDFEADGPPSEMRLEDAFYCAACGEPLSRTDAPCPACGALPPEIDDEDELDEPPETDAPGSLDRMRTLRKPVSLLLLAPLVLVLTFLVALPLLLVGMSGNGMGFAVLGLGVLGLLLYRVLSSKPRKGQ